MAQNNLGKWIVEAGIDGRGFESGAKRLTDTARNAENQLGGIFGRMSAMSPTTFLSGLGAGLGGAGFMAQFQQATEAAENIGFLNDQLGTSIEWLTALQTAAGESGISAQAFETSLQRLHQTIGNAALGSAEAQATFRDLGLSWDRLRSQRFDQTFSQVAGALAGIEDRSVRARLSMELFGREGGRVMQRLTAGGAEGLAASIADVQARGGFMTQADLDRLLQADRALDAMATRSATFWRNMNVGIAPFITAFLDGLERVDRVIGRIIAHIREQPPSLLMTWAARPEQMAMTPEEFAQLPAAGTSMEGLQQSQRLALAQEGQASMRVALAEQAVQAARERLAAAPRGDVLLGGGPTAEQQAALRALADAEHSLNARRQEAAEAAARLEQAENLVKNAREQQERDAERARAEQLRQAEAQMATTRRLAAEAASPFDRIQARFRQIAESGLSSRQQGALLDRLVPTLGAAPLLGGLRADSSETASIIQASMNPQTDRLADIQSILEVIRDESTRTNQRNEEMGRHMERIRGIMEANA